MIIILKLKIYCMQFNVDPSPRDECAYRSLIHQWNICMSNSLLYSWLHFWILFLFESSEPVKSLFDLPKQAYNRNKCNIAFVLHLVRQTLFHPSLFLFSVDVKCSLSKENRKPVPNLKDLK